MRKTHTRIVGAVAALLAAGLAGFSLRSQPRPSTALAARSPAPIVTTQVIRRTIHIVRHQHVGRAAGHGRSLRAGGQVGIQRSRSIRTGASGAHGAGSAATGAAAAGAVVTTRTSPSHSAPGSAA